MQRSRDFASCRTKAGRAKNPRNDELHKVLFGHEPRGALHDALLDVRVTAKNFFELRRRRAVVPACFWPE